jgi:glycerol-3-phosphate acyltransferase PlsX
VIVALDAMGGDAAPGPELAGAVQALRARDRAAARGRAEGAARAERSKDPGPPGGDLSIIAVGDLPRMNDELARHGGVPRGLRLVHASEVVTMDDQPGQAFRKKKDSSLRVATELVASGQAHALVSAGNSGAVLACGIFVLGRLPGVERPPVVTVLPTPAGPLVLCDAGANVDVKPPTLAQFGMIGACYDRVVHGRAKPRVGLLSNGAEPGKGTELTRAAHAILVEAAPRAAMQYAGYVEGSDLFRGAIDVAVTDGFTGNLILKTCEGIADGVFGMIRAELAGSRGARLGAALVAPALKRLARKLDYAETGGALLAGVNGAVVLAHGRSNAAAIASAIREAASFADKRIVDEMRRAIGDLGEPATGRTA